MVTYRGLYKKLIEPFKNELWAYRLTSAPIMVGTDYYESDFRLMYVGRAVNGWEGVWKDSTEEELLSRILTPDFDIKDIADKPLQEPDKDGKRYNFNKSPFWQLCRRIMEQKGEEKSWSNRIAWSNLYKIAPYKTGNPDDKTIAASIENCIELLEEEINHYAPSHIVFVTDTWWMEPSNITPHSFAKALGISLDSTAGTAIVGHGVYKTSKIIVTKRPERLSLSRQEHAKQILDAFETM